MNWEYELGKRPFSHQSLFREAVRSAREAEWLLSPTVMFLNEENTVGWYWSCCVDVGLDD